LQVATLDGAAVYKIKQVDVYTHAEVEIDRTDRK
jgi:hypothetical protein